MVRAAVRVTAAGLFLLGVANARGTPVQEAEKLLTAGKAGQAAELLRECVRQNPSDPYLSYNYGLALYRAGRLDEANTVFETVSGLSGDRELDAKALFQMGTIALKKGVALRTSRNDLGAVRAFEQALGQYQAEEKIHSSRELKANRETATRELETTLLAIGAERTRANTEKTLREALQAYERAAELNPQNQPRVREAKSRLSERLEQEAAAAEAKVSQAEAQAPALSPKVFRGLLEQRQQIASRLEEALRLTPEKKSLAAALAQQQAGMSRLLTRAARDESAEALNAPASFSKKNLHQLESAAEKLGQAAALDASNHEATELAAKVKSALENGYMNAGDFAFDHLQKGLEAEKAAEAKAADSGKPAPLPPKYNADGQLQNALGAADAYSKALTLAPKNQKARENLAAVNALLPGLYFKAGKSGLDRVEAKLAGKEPGAASAKGQPGSASQASPGELQAAAADLERVVQNLDAAAGLKPENAPFQNELAKAQELIKAVRSELEKAPGTAAAGKTGGEGKAAGSGTAGAKGRSTLQSMSALRPKNKRGGGIEGSDSKRYWNRFVQDW